jgi:antitoxin component of MazEF toxin-antitoxin module
MRCGNSRAVRFTKEDRDHLGVGADAEVQIHYTPNAIILTKPHGFEEALERTQKQLTELLGPLKST